MEITTTPKEQTMTTKTQVTQIQPGNVIDWAAHRGVVPVLDRPADISVSDWAWHGERPTGQLQVASVERVSAQVTGGMHYSRATAIRVTFTNGRSVDCNGAMKVPVAS